MNPNSQDRAPGSSTRDEMTGKPAISFRRTATLGMLVVVSALSWPCQLAAAPVQVRFAEGATRGFLLLRTMDGARIATGDLIQSARDGAVEKRMVFRFTDGSVYDESVVFTQERVYSMHKYRLSQNGPAFTEDAEISLERATGKYRVKTKTRKDGHEEGLEGTLDLPPDVYNGMILNVTKDLPRGASETVHLVAFIPGPRLIEMELAPAGEHTVMVGHLAKTAVHYVFKPKLGLWLKLFATLLGRVPSDCHAWILTDEVPAFVRFEGPLTPTGPVWRIELTSPSWPE